MVSTSSTEAEYVAAASCYRQVLWIQNQMLDYGYNFMHTMINIDNNSTICIVKNPVSHTKTKHMEIRYHFIKDYNDKKLIQVVQIHTDNNFADLLTKALDVGRQVKRGRDTNIPQSSGPPVKVGDEAVHKELGDRMERAATTASNLEADYHFGVADAQTRFEAASKQSNDPPLSRVNTLGSGRTRRQKEVKGFIKSLIYSLIESWKSLLPLMEESRLSLKHPLEDISSIEDSDGISTLPTAEIFKQLALMG
ncbi:hypothetical protein Tco_1339853, partial [Tanacetum coccineum]